MKIPIGDIKIKKRIRQDDGDLASLQDSIRRNGLINPVTVTEKGVLIAGYRRLKACREMGMEEIECRVIPSPSRLERLVMEADENLIRKDFTPVEEARLREEMEYLSSRGWEHFRLWVRRLIASIRDFIRRAIAWIRRDRS